VHNLFGLRPTKGLSSIDGIVPLSHTQDVAGPLARTVTDLAIALDATIGPDPADSATRLLDGRSTPRFITALDSTALRGTRLGVLTSYFGTETDDAEGARVVRAAVERMKARGAEIIEITIPGLDTLVSRAGVIDYEFKYDLIDYLAKVPGAPVRSLKEIIDQGLLHSALDATIRRRDSVGTRDSEAYRSALGRRRTTRDLVVAFLDSARLDAIVYPTMRRKPAHIDEPQRGSNCQLSAVTGLPALSIPAGFTPDGLPMGVELLGRPLADARLVAIAFDYEQSTRPRRSPSTTPALVGGRAPVPLRFAAVARGGDAAAHGEFVFDPMRRTLAFSIRLSGVPAARVYGVSIQRDSAGQKGPVVHSLSGPSLVRSDGTLMLGDRERRDLLAGRLTMVLFTRDQAGGAIRGTIHAQAARSDQRTR
jgi:hypothetical protein